MDVSVRSIFLLNDRKDANAVSAEIFGGKACRLSRPVSMIAPALFICLMFRPETSSCSQEKMMTLWMSLYSSSSENQASAFVSAVGGTKTETRRSGGVAQDVASLTRRHSGFGMRLHLRCRLVPPSLSRGMRGYIVKLDRITTDVSIQYSTARLANAMLHSMDAPSHCKARLLRSRVLEGRGSLESSKVLETFQN